MEYKAMEITFKGKKEKILMIGYGISKSPACDETLKKWGVWDSVVECRPIYHNLEYYLGYNSRYEFKPMSFWQKIKLAFSIIKCGSK